MNLIILGPQGSGKGTQARILSEKLGLYYFESGDFSRELAKNNLRIKEIINRGELIPEQEMTNYVLKYLDKNVPSGKNIIFDSYPRFLTQYQSLKKWLETKGSKIDAVILLEISEDETIKRLSARRTCIECGMVYNLITNPPKNSNKCDKCGGELIQREDDFLPAIKRRLARYRENTYPIIDYIDKEKFLLKINGEQPIEEITKEILSRLQK